MIASRSLFATLLAFALLVACSSDSGNACDSSKCAAGNTCLGYQGQVRCRKLCSSNSDPKASCPAGYACVPNGSTTDLGSPGMCVASAVAGVTPKPTGQFGFACQANLGAENPACDGDQGFFCYGVSPTDGDAYCTRYDCTSDADCGPGFWCGQMNRTPNIATAKRSTVGQVQNVCLRRTYCTPCSIDLDCADIGGHHQRCRSDDSGASVCMPECDSNQACPNEARCATFEDLDVKLCYPRAKVCVGDGSLCSPCRVDTDCGDDGICVKGQYTTEKSCAKKSSGDCTQCPKTATGVVQRQVGCSKTGFDELPANYCVGLYGIGGNPSDLGCWTPDR